MQGQRSSIEPFPEAFEFDHGSSSSTSNMDQQMLWNTMLLNPVETQDMPDFMQSPADANMPYLNMANQDGSRLSIWSSGGPSSSQHVQGQGSCAETKLEHEWIPPLTINSGTGPRIEERNFEAANMLSPENVNINLNAGLVDHGQSFFETSILNDRHQNLEYTADRVGTVNEVTPSRLSHPYALGFLNSERFSSSIGSSNPCESSSADIGPMSEDDGRPGSSLDGRRLACKRKNIEGFPGQSSTNGNANSSHQGENSLQHAVLNSYNPLTGLSIAGSSDPLSVANYTEDHPSGLGTVIRGMPSEFYSSANAAGNAESLHRNYRMRINPAHSHDLPPTNLRLTNAVRRSNTWSLNQPPSHSIPSNHLLEPMQGLATLSSQNQPHVSVVPGMPHAAYRFAWDGTANSGTGSSSSPFNTDERMVDTRAETNSRNTPLASNLDFVPAAETRTRQMTQDPDNSYLGIRGVSTLPTSRTGTSSALQHSLVTSWVPHQNASTQNPRSLSEAVQQSMLPAGSSEFGVQGNSFPVQHSGHSLSSQEIAQQIRSSLHALRPPPQIRSAYSMERQTDGAPLPVRSLAATREGRSRMISEICHAFESMRRVDGLRFEDIFMIDQTLILAGADLHDRHRDMRLDVDNMSYEELLALEERIGNVSTGLTEETLMKCLKQKRYSIRNSGESMEDEPCCICQEEYVEGEKLGTLDCGHDFHTACIKQWLMHKNLCPICKNTALVT